MKKLLLALFCVCWSARAWGQTPTPFVACGAGETSQTFVIATDTDDCVVYKNGSSVYPPNTTAVADCFIGSSKQAAARDFFAGPIYQEYVSVLRWDTSSLPDNVTIYHAYLRVYLQGRADTNGLSLIAGYYSTWPITNAAYTELVSPADAISGVTLASLPNSDGPYYSIPLDGLTGINLVGYTGLRVGLTESGAPTGANEFMWYDLSHSGTTAAQLEVCYAVAGPTNTPTPTPTHTPTPSAGPTFPCNTTADCPTPKVCQPTPG